MTNITNSVTFYLLIYLFFSLFTGHSFLNPFFMKKRIHYFLLFYVKEPINSLFVNLLKPLYYYWVQYAIRGMRACTTEPYWSHLFFVLSLQWLICLLIMDQRHDSFPIVPCMSSVLLLFCVIKTSSVLLAMADHMFFLANWISLISTALEFSHSISLFNIDKIYTPFLIINFFWSWWLLWCA